MLSEPQLYPKTLEMSLLLYYYMGNIYLVIISSALLAQAVNIQIQIIHASLCDCYIHRSEYWREIEHMGICLQDLTSYGDGNWSATLFSRRPISSARRLICISRPSFLTSTGPVKNTSHRVIPLYWMKVYIMNAWNVSSMSSCQTLKAV